MTLDDNAPSQGPERLIIEVLPSLYFGPGGTVLITDCGHRHLRPAGQKAAGEMMRCPFCVDSDKA